MILSHSREIITLTAALLLAACSGNPAPTPTPTATPTPTPTPTATASAAEPAPWVAELADLNADGSRSLASALRLFAMAFGPIPGVDAQQVNGVLSATPATRVVLAQMDQLTADQRTAVQGYTTPPTNAEQFDVPASPTAAGRRLMALAGTGGVAAFPDQPRALSPIEQQLNALVGELRAFFETHGADVGSWAIHVVLEPGASPMAWSTLTFGPDFFGGFQCTLYVSGNSDPASAQMRHVMAHEIFHCFQGAYLAKDPLGAGQAASLSGSTPAWIWEGGSEYAALLASGTSAGHEDAWPTYLAQPGIPLFSRTYDAVGFYAHLVAIGVVSENEMISRLSGFQMLVNLSSPERFVFAGGGDSTFLDTWASGLARDPSRGVAWDTDGPQITSESAPRQAFTLSDGDVEAVSQDAYTNGLYAVNVQADLVTVAIGGHARLSDGSTDTTDLANATFCVNPDGCQPCPDSEPITAPQLAPGFLLAVSGGQIGASGSLSAATLDKDCETPPTATPGQALRAHIDRPDMPAYAFMAGTVFDATSCDGPYGHWAGYVGAGGLAYQGHVLVPWKELPIEFSFSGSEGTASTSVTAAGVVTYQLPVPQQIEVSYPIQIEVNEKTMSVIGLTGFVTGESPLTPIQVTLEPAPPGTCD